MKVNRRHLLKGSLAAPLVLTVRSAAGHGMSTRSMTCYEKDKQKADDDDLKNFQKDPRADTWMRREVQVCELEKKNDKGEYKRLKNEEYFKDDDGCYCQLVKKGDDYDVVKNYDYKYPKVREYKQLRKEYALVCVDERGEVKSWGWEKKGYQPVSCSCWTSLKGWQA